MSVYVYFRGKFSNYCKYSCYQSNKTVKCKTASKLIKYVIVVPIVSVSYIYGIQGIQLPVLWMCLSVMKILGNFETVYVYRCDNDFFWNNIYGYIVLHTCVLGPILGFVIMIVFLLGTGTGNYD